MKRNYSTAYAIVCMIMLLGGFLTTFYFAWMQGVEDMIYTIMGFLLAFILAPTVHELGHVVFAKLQNMQIYYTKFFCITWKYSEGKGRLGFTSPFSPDQTQAVPKTGETMQKRAVWYTLGGLIFSAAYLLLVGVGITVFCLLEGGCFLFWGLLPYSAYLFLLNVVPAEYPTGKTDTAVYVGIKKGHPEEINMLCAMQIQGQLFEGKSYSEIDKSLYFDAPQLCEDEPLFAIICDLRYRYFLELNEYDKAAEWLNRLASIQLYLSAEETGKVAAELAYMHAVAKDVASANESAKFCQNYLKSQTVTAKRIMSAIAFAIGKEEECTTLKAQANALMETEMIKGVAKAEEILLSRIG